jgi:hypothetical protein
MERNKQERFVMLELTQDVLLTAQDQNRTLLAREEASPLLQYVPALLTTLSIQLLVLVYQPVEMERSKQEKDVTMEVWEDVLLTV